MDRPRFSSLATALGCAFAAAALAQQPAPPPAFAAPNLTAKGVQAMAANCAICHGTQGRPAPGSSVPPLAGRPADSIVEAMKAFKEGRREATVMSQIAKGFSDAEIAAMAAHFAAQSKEAP
jgi:cytochrome subunit of sulfide dehydrogenase